MAELKPFSEFCVERQRLGRVYQIEAIKKLYLIQKFQDFDSKEDT